MARDLVAELERLNAAPSAPANLQPRGRDLVAELEALQAQTPPQTELKRPIPAGASAALAGFQQVNPKSGRIVENIGKAITGEEMQTPEIQAMPEIGEAPELGGIDKASLKTSFGLLTADSEDALKGVLTEQYGEDVSFSADSKGNTIVNLPSGSYALNKPGLSGQDIARTAFSMAAFLGPAKINSVVGAGAGAAATELALEKGEEAVGGEFNASDVGAAGVIGGAFKGLEKIIGAGYRAITGSARSPVVEAGKEAGVPVMTSDVFPPRTFAGRMGQQVPEKIPLAGTGGVRETQQLAREQAVADIADRYSQYSYDTIVDSLRTQKSRVKSAAGEVLSRVGRDLDQVGPVNLTSTTRAIRDALPELEKRGVIRSEGAMQDLDTLITAMRETPQTFTTLKENLTAFREIVKGADKAERTQLTSRAKALLQRVEQGMKRDLDRAASDNLSVREYSRWKRANAIYRDEAEKFTKSRLKNVLDKGDVAPENVGNMLFSKKPSEVKALYNSLTNEGRQNARAAIISRVVERLGDRITPNTFATEMGKQGLQISTFFKGRERNQLEGFLRLLNATRRAQDAPIVTPTGQQLLGAGILAAGATDLGATIGIAGTVGGLARLYESAPVRNVLLRLSSQRPGSSQFERTLREAAEILSASAQTGRQTTQGE